MFKNGDKIAYMDEITGEWKTSTYNKYAYGRHFMNDGSEIIYSYHIKKIV